MRAVRGVFAGLMVLAAPALASPQAAPGGALAIAMPDGGDEYSVLVARAAAGDKTVDFHALRFAYLKSKAHKELDPKPLQQALFDAGDTGDHQKIHDAAVKLLSANYIDMWGHKFLWEACMFLHDDACKVQGQFVQMGLLRSILATGGGKECRTGWEVVSIDEEYFMLSMVGAKVKGQTLVDGTPSCDKIDFVNQDGKDQSYYFRIDAVLADEAKGLGK